MIQVSRNEYETLIHGAKLLEQDRHGPKVYETPDGRVVKLFRVKRRFSSNLLCPYALRFSRNAARLAKVGVPSLTVEKTGVVPHLQRQVVVYGRLPGETVRHALRRLEPELAARLMRRLGVFLSVMHEKGVYFRSMHFGNVLVDGNDDAFSLIDILDLKVLNGPLGLRRRRRNFKHMIRYDEDRRHMREHWAAIRAGYGDAGTNGLLDEWERQLR